MVDTMEEGMLEYNVFIGKVISRVIMSNQRDYQAPFKRCVIMFTDGTSLEINAIIDSYGLCGREDPALIIKEKIV